MKHRILKIVAVLVFFAGSGLLSAEPSEAESLTVYTYESFPAEIINSFEETYCINVTVYNNGDAGTIMNRAIMEKESPVADVIIGIDNSMAYDAIESGILQPYEASTSWSINTSFVFDEDNYLTPYDYGYFALIYDTDTVPADEAPKTFEDLLSAEFKGRIVLQDPRTSSTGLGFLFWVKSVYGDEASEYFRELSGNGAVYIDGWWASWEAFTNGEYDFVLSYATSPAYPYYYENDTTLRAVILDDAGYMQIEGAGIINGTDKLSEAKLFIDYLTGYGIQSNISRMNWMVPVRTDVSLGYEYSTMPYPGTDVTMDIETIGASRTEWIKEWEDSIIFSDESPGLSVIASLAVPGLAALMHRRKA